MQKTNKFFALISTFIFVIYIFSAPLKIKADDLQAQLDNLTKQIEATQNEKVNLQTQIDSNNYTINGYTSDISNLYGQAEILNKQVEELDLETKQLNLQIDDLNKQIDAEKKDITDTEVTVGGLEKESEARIKDSYVNYRMYGDNDNSSTLTNITNINQYFKETQYKEILQSDTNKVMVKLTELKQSLQDKKDDLENKLADIKRKQDTVDANEVDLSRQKDELSAKMAAFRIQIDSIQNTNNSTQSQISTLDEDISAKSAQAEQLRQELFRNTVVSGSYVYAGQLIGYTGCTGWCYGEHLHFMVEDGNSYQDPCGYLPPNPNLTNSGGGGSCGWGNAIEWPLYGSIYYTDNFYSLRCDNSGYCFQHNAIDIVGSPHAPIYAAQSGYITKGVDGYGANFVKICQNPNCWGGINTGYWHLSEFTF